MSTAAERALADPSLTAEERENLELVLKFRGLPRSERSKYTVEGFRPSRKGMPNLDALKAPDAEGFTPESIPDREDEILDIIAKGDRVWATWLIRGTHLGELMGIAPTGRTVAVLEAGQWRITDGLISEAWFFVDELGLLRELGRTPTWETN